MAPSVIENPILNSPFHAPERHFRFDDEGITGDVIEGRRESGYFLPIASPRKRSGQLKFETEWTQDQFLSSPRINVEFAHDAADRIYLAIVSAHDGETRIKPILRPYEGEELGSARFVSFDTTKPTYATHPDRSHVSHVVLDSDWEAKMAQTLEDLDEVACYVKNHGVQFTIPYTLNGDQKQYYPDYLVRCRSGLNLIVEVSGEGRKDKAAKVNAARTLWVPAVNNDGGLGSWAFVEVTDPWDAKGTIRAAIAETLPILQRADKVSR